MRRMRRLRRPGRQNAQDRFSGPQGSGRPNSRPGGRSGEWRGGCMHTPRSASGGGPGEKKEGESEQQQQSSRFFVIAQPVEGEAKVHRGYKAKGDAVRFYNQLKRGINPMLRTGVVQAPTPKAALELWAMHQEAELEKQTRPAPATPIPGTESGRAREEEAAGWGGIPAIGRREDEDPAGVPIDVDDDQDDEEGDDEATR